MAVPMVVGTGPKRLIRMCHLARGHVGRILWTVALDYPMKERHARLISSGNNVRIAQFHASYDHDKRRDYDT